MADIFISYASEDRDRIKPLVDFFESEGWSVWWDRQLITGSSFDLIIEQELDASRCVVVAWSANSVKSHWCRNEASEGLERNILVPLTMDTTRPPLAFRSLQTASLSDWPGEKGEAEALLIGVRRCLSTPNDKPEAETGASIRFERSVLVHSISGTGEDAYLNHLAAGVSGEIASILGGYQELRTSVTVDASYTLDGSIQVRDESLVIRAELTRASDGKPVWADSYDRPRSIGLADQADLARSIARHVRFQLVRDHEYETIRRESKNPEAAEYLCTALRDNYGTNQGGEFDIEYQITNLRKALDLEPTLVDAHFTLALLYSSGTAPGIGPREAEKCAREALDAADAVAPRHPKVVWIRGHIQLRFDLDYDTAERTIQRAISLDPLGSHVRWFHASIAQCHISRGNLAEGIKHYRRAVKIYDSDARMHAEYARTLNMAGEHIEAVRIANNGLELVERGLMRGVLLREKTIALAATDHMEEANATADEAVESVGLEWRSSLIATLASVGRTEDAQDAAESLKNMPFQNYPVAVYGYVALRNFDEAFQWLHKAIDARYGDLVHGIRCDPRYSEMRKDPRWDELIQHLEQEEAVGRARNRDQ